MKKEKNITLTMSQDNFRVCWHSIKTMLDNNIPNAYEVPLLIQTMEKIAIAIDEANKSNIVKLKMVEDE